MKSIKQEDLLFLLVNPRLRILVLCFLFFMFLFCISIYHGQVTSFEEMFTPLSISIKLELYFLFEKKYL